MVLPIQIFENSIDYYDNLGIRKAILLSRYGNLLKQWVFDVRESYHLKQEVTHPRINQQNGLFFVSSSNDISSALGTYTKSPADTIVPRAYLPIFQTFGTYFSNEMKEI